MQFKIQSIHSESGYNATRMSSLFADIILVLYFRAIVCVMFLFFFPQFPVLLSIWLRIFFGLVVFGL